MSSSVVFRKPVLPGGGTLCMTNGGSQVMPASSALSWNGRSSSLIVEF
jgi:hypothetical protein